jgi:cell division transport system permease protein
LATKPFVNKLRSASLTTVVSISLVLFILGLLGLLILNGQKITQSVKEQANIQLFLNNNVKDADIAKLQKSLEASYYVKSTGFISKDSAAKQLYQHNKEDFESLLQYNPLPASINVHLKAAYINMDSIKWIEKRFTAFPQVKEVIYQESMIDGMNRNIRKVSIVLFGFSLLLLLVSLTLINNTIRLTIYSKRFLIKTMQLVGATRTFISMPFIWKGIQYGVTSALISLSMILGVMHLAERQMPDLKSLDDMNTYFMLAGIVLVLGVFISSVSTFFALRRYLRLKTDDLYF